MPTFDVSPLFWHDWAKLSPEQRAIFQRTIVEFYHDLKAGQGFRNGLRVKGVQGHDGVWEMTWSGDGRATFQFGNAIKEGHTHIIWRRIGGHKILKTP